MEEGARLTTEPITAAWSPSSCFLSLLRLAVIEFWLNGALTSVPSNTAICKTVFRSLLRDQVCSAACDSLRQTCLQHAGVQSSDSKRVEAYMRTPILLKLVLCVGTAVTARSSVCPYL